MKWLCFVDSNTAFFHKMAKIRYMANHLSFLKKDGHLFDGQSDIEKIVVDYFSDIYALENSIVHTSLVESLIPSVEDNCMLMNVPTREEVRSLVFEMNGDGASRLDG